MHVSSPSIAFRFYDVSSHTEVQPVPYRVRLPYLDEKDSILEKGYSLMVVPTCYAWDADSEVWHASDSRIRTLVFDDTSVECEVLVTGAIIAAFSRIESYTTSNALTAGL